MEVTMDKELARIREDLLSMLEGYIGTSDELWDIRTHTLVAILERFTADKNEYHGRNVSRFLEIKERYTVYCDKHGYGE
jgi:hypothetical protein